MTTDKNRTTVYMHPNVFNLMRVWRLKLKIGRENNDSQVIAKAASVFFLIGEERLSKLLRVATAQNNKQRLTQAGDPVITLAIALLSKAIDDMEEGDG